MAIVMPQVLQAHIINERVSRIKVHNTEFQRVLGFERGGSNVRLMPGRYGSYDVFNDTREVATGRLPGTPAGTISPNAVANVPFVLPRTFEKMYLPLEMIRNIRMMGGPAGQLDGASLVGMSYIAEQERVMRQRITNVREFQTAAMLSGSYSYTILGDNIIHGFSGGQYTINFQIPSTNTGDCNGIIGSVWGTSGTAATSVTILSQLRAINAAMEKGVGRSLKHIFCTSVVWGYVAQNTQVQNEAGSVNRYFDTLEEDGASGFTFRLHAFPTVIWHVSDRGLNLGGVNGTAGTFTKLVPDTVAIMLPEPDNDIFTYYEGSEPVCEWIGRPPHDEYGEYYYAAPTANPAGYELYQVFNGMPIVKIPGAIYYATVGA